MTFDVSGVEVRRGDRVVLKDIDLQVARGEAVALVGPSGAGKTTLLRLLGLSLPPSAGSFRVDGQPPSPELRQRIGFVHQDLALVPNLSVVKNVLMGAVGQQSTVGSVRSVLWPSDAESERVHSLLTRLGVAEKMYQRVDALSGGEAQRVAIARALYGRPTTLLADEPVSAVDPARSEGVLELLVTLCADEGITLVMSLHQVARARRLPRLVGLRDGRVVFDRPATGVDEDALEALYAL